ncbi:type I-F CRISPR-associated endoribonuclease Cas6/Csy4 [Providencia vermicola]|uniref:Type I-F CRISPR-associated endoribonuclease Cas6/Csy4 n=2 Tax=Providencia TaxID=586 RepID=A0ABD5L0E2_PROST|nr:MULTISPECIES: type I-F CRISPR-associated endoribonuclease Cas6/Csy4 [Providencia]ELR5044016.1 type I-F CRISPR-associated endoribonuclease Cas6/Csy4 [Providencia rettgeri]ELR5120314.1 type I-F CRISPR-associated endoribonuclease Cas6/Csy4 [Providencia stuartii]ELR5123301.1 type I-F CRISPR-associated endoribonuclease Cas6/Csy4 [Providencia stuartii]ELR5292085.1 type I-F CRISPR-associated endoribonuclease Cas6/Csy4 [Providencia stuartii]ELX8378598.1 type I-F CRISPR-associated endoribonuclease C
MNYYQEITLLPDSTIPLDFLWQRVYQQIHIALVENKSETGHSEVAVAFPEYGSVGFRLGKKIRLIANTEAMLAQLNVNHWLARLSDYVHVKSILTVPENAIPVSYVRQHVKGKKRTELDIQKKAQFLSIKSGQPAEVCLHVLRKNQVNEFSRLPFIWMESQQSKSKYEGAIHRPFPLFIRCISAGKAQLGGFNCYGLSQQVGRDVELATVPHF